MVGGSNNIYHETKENTNDTAKKDTIENRYVVVPVDPTKVLSRLANGSTVFMVDLKQIVEPKIFNLRYDLTINKIEKFVKDKHNVFFTIEDNAEKQ